MRILAAVLTALLAAPLAIAEDKINGMTLMQAMDRYNQLNIICRGESGDDPKTHEACRQRNELGRAIKGYGWCYVAGWKKCGPAITKAEAVREVDATNDWRRKHIQVGAQQDCFLVAGTIALVPLWRDNNVPIAKVHANLDDVLVQTGASDREKKEWHQLASGIYSSRVTSSEVEQQLRPPCVRLSDGQ